MFAALKRNYLKRTANKNTYTDLSAINDNQVGKFKKILLVWNDMPTFNVKFNIMTQIHTVCSDDGLTLETSATHHIPQVTNLC